MKNITPVKILTPSVFLAILLFVSCSKDITEVGTDWQQLAPTKLDTAAGNWKTCVLATADDIKISAPDAVTSAAYQAELAEVKAAVANQTDAQKAAIKYWSAGNVLRWNEIMRAYVAKHNLPPQDSVGAYPIPSQTNPFAYPEFPFSNPP